MTGEELRQLWELANRFWDELEGHGLGDDDGWCGFMLPLRDRCQEAGILPPGEPPSFAPLAPAGNTTLEVST